MFAFMLAVRLLIGLPKCFMGSRNKARIFAYIRWMVSFLVAFLLSQLSTSVGNGESGFAVVHFSIPL